MRTFRLHQIPDGERGLGGAGCTGRRREAGRNGRGTGSKKRLAVRAGGFGGTGFARSVPLEQRRVARHRETDNGVALPEMERFTLGPKRAAMFLLNPRASRAPMLPFLFFAA